MLIVCVFLCSGCCLSPETKILARRIANSTATQRVELSELANIKLETGETLAESQRGRILIKRAEKLEEVTAGLADILGAPKEVE